MQPAAHSLDPLEDWTHEDVVKWLNALPEKFAPFTNKWPPSADGEELAGVNEEYCVKALGELLGHSLYTRLAKLPRSVNPRPTTPPHRSPPDVNEGTPAADAKSNLASTTLIEISDPSIEDLRDVLKLYPYYPSANWSLVHLQHPIPNSHRPIVDMLCCYVFEQQQRSVQDLASALGLAEADVQRSLLDCRMAFDSLERRQKTLESDWRAELYEPLARLAFVRRQCYRGATIRVLQESSKKYFNPDLIVCELDTPGDLIYNHVKAHFTERVEFLPSCVMEFKKNDVLGDICKVGAMQLLIMQHQERWLKCVSEQLKANNKADIDTIRTWLRLPYCIGVHMDRDGCAFAYLSPDANVAEQRAWVCFPLINWRNGGLLCIARIFMELELVNRSYWDSIARIMHHLNPALPPVPQRSSLPEEVNRVDTNKKVTVDPFETIGTFAATFNLPPMQRLSDKHEVFVAERVVFKCTSSFAAARRECTMLLRVRPYPRFYVHLRATFRDEEGKYWLEMDRLPGSGLGGFTDNNALRTKFRSLLKTLGHLHSVPQLIHGDIKPANLFYDRLSKAVVLMDFGSAVPGPLHRGVLAGTAGYEAPEAIKGFACFKSDVYSAACTVISTLLTKQSTLVQVISASKNGELALQQQLRVNGWHASLALASLLCGMLKSDPAARLSSQGALQHVYFTEKEN